VTLNKTTYGGGNGIISPLEQYNRRKVTYIRKEMTNRSLQDGPWREKGKAESLEKFMRVRENAEVEAKKRIEKLNRIMAKRYDRDKKAAKIIKENSVDTMMRLQKLEDKRS